MEKKEKLLNSILNVDLMIAGAAFVVLVITTFMGVIMRYAVGSPLVWLEEVQLFCFLWMAMMGGSMVFRHGSHICIDILVDSLPAGLQRVISYLIVAVNTVVLAYVCTRGWAYVVQMHMTNRATNILSIPFALIYAILPLGCVLMIINQIVMLFMRKEA